MFPEHFKPMGCNPWAFSYTVYPIEQWREIAVERHNHAYLLFMLILSVLALAALAVEAAFPLDAGTRSLLGYADTTICAVFFLDFLILFFRAESKRKYMLTWGWIDLLSCIPMLDAARWGRAARVMRIFRVLRGLRSVRIVSHFVLEHRAQSGLLAVSLLSITILCIASISVLHFEADAEGNNIKSPEDALWWAVVTITTVGYGDKFPTTSEGRLVGTALMIAGVGLFSTFSGLIAAWFLAPGRQAAQDERTAIRQEIAELKRIVLENRSGDSA
jgi:voltage-gated potassium channel